MTATEVKATFSQSGDAEVKGRVLVVDDEEYVRGIVTSMLKSIGYEAVEASDGDKGLAIFSDPSSQFDACIIDLTMPGMGGIELLERIRDLDADIPILLVSGYSRHEVRQREAKSTNVSFLQKPFTLDQFRTSMSAQFRTD